ncbi:MAG: hypothetical protein KDM64_17980, partial [Verrucomicrobiae bacterium]|nr:hypothetical protein [Verrucomicrobiae bacterium]
AAAAKTLKTRSRKAAKRQRKARWGASFAMLGTMTRRIVHLAEKNRAALADALVVHLNAVH